jgi:endonuclease/exonuclease/phosphatase family metal-dependent hydrolase
MRNIIITVLSAMLLATAYTAYSQPKPKKSGTLRIMTYNVGTIEKHISDTFSKADNVALLGKIIRNSQADAVCVQELDSCGRNKYFQLEALTKAIDENWHFLFGRAVYYYGGAFGAGMTAAKKPIRSFNIFIPTPEGSEDRNVAVMEFEDYVVCSTHLNYNQPHQVDIINAEMKRLYGDSSKPVFLGGDMNAQPKSEMMQIFEQEWTIISTMARTTVQDRMVCIDFILQLNNRAKRVEVVDSQVIHSHIWGNVNLASDHYPVYVDIKLQ